MEPNYITTNYNALPLISFARSMVTQQAQEYNITPCMEQEQEQEEMVYCHNSAKISDKKINDDFIFPIDRNDALFVLTFNPSVYKEGTSSLISKMMIINELSYVNLDDLSKTLAAMYIKELNIFSLDDNTLEMRKIRRDNGSSITYIEMTREHFIKLLNNDRTNFLDYNRYSLYILRNGNFLDIKNLFSRIDGYPANVGRGGSQKAHILSPLDFRLSSYIMAMFNFNYGLISNINAFNTLEKERYLSYLNRTNEKKNELDKEIRFKRIYP